MPPGDHQLEWQQTNTRPDFLIWPAWGATHTRSKWTNYYKLRFNLNKRLEVVLYCSQSEQMTAIHTRRPLMFSIIILPTSPSHTPTLPKLKASGWANYLLCTTGNRNHYFSCLVSLQFQISIPHKDSLQTFLMKIQFVSRPGLPRGPIKWFLRCTWHSILTQGNKVIRELQTKTL